MKFRLCLALCAVLVAPLCAPPKKSVAKVARRSVLDYFRLLPEQKYFNLDREKLLRPALKPTIDLGNDYLATAGFDAQPGYQMAIFRYRGRDVVAISANYAGDHDFELLRYEKGKWQTVTQTLSPVADADGLHFVLPRYGTTIRVFNLKGQLLAKLYWENGRFSAESFDPSGHLTDAPS